MEGTRYLFGWFDYEKARDMVGIDLIRWGENVCESFTTAKSVTYQPESKNLNEV